MSRRDPDFLVGVAEKVQRRLADNPADADRIAVVVREEANVVLSDVEVLHVLRKLRHDSYGIGELEELLNIEGVTDIVVNGPKNVWFDRGNGLERAGIRFDSDASVRRLATRLLAATGRRIDDAQCFADGRFTRADGTVLRVHALLSPPSNSGTCLSLRVLRQSTESLEQLRDMGTFDDEVLGMLRNIVALNRSFLVVGGTGSGKTTLLAAMLATVEDHRRLICIEDTQELNPRHPHLVSLTTRTSNAEGVGEVSMSDLLKQSLRMRPDRIVLGEIRGGEVVDLLAALNTGHDGCAGTIHANDIHEVPARLEALAARGGMERDALQAQLAAARPLVLAMRRDADGRKLVRIGELAGNPVEVHVFWELKEAQ